MRRRPVTVWMRPAAHPVWFAAEAGTASAPGIGLGDGAVGRLDWGPAATSSDSPSVETPTVTNQPMPPGPGQPAYGPPPGYPQPVAPATGPKKKKWPWIAGGAGALVLLACLGTMTGGDTTDTASTGPEKAAAAEPAAPTPAKPAKPAQPAANKATEATEADPADALPGFGDPAKDGKFQFTVTKMSCGRTSVGSSFLNQKAQGQFCLVTVKVKNIGDKAQMFAGSNQKAYDAKGTEFSNDSGAEIYANSEAQTFLQEINPGNAVTGKLVFDVPKSTKLVRLELHDSIFSGGVEVALKK